MNKTYSYSVAFTSNEFFVMGRNRKLIWIETDHQDPEAAIADAKKYMRDQGGGSGAYSYFGYVKVERSCEKESE